MSKSKIGINNSQLVGFICGGGGFTAEMLLLVRALNLKKFRFIISGGLHFDHATLGKIQKEFPENNRVVTIENPSLITLSFVHRLYSYLLNILESFGIVFLKKFDVYIGIGSFLCVPIFFFSKIKGKKCIYIECFTRVDELSATGRMIYRFNLADSFYVFHESLSIKYNKSIVVN